MLEYANGSKGEVKVAGFDMQLQEREARKHLAFVPDVPRFFLELTAWEHLRFIAAANESLDGFGQRAEKLLRDFNLWHVRNHFPHRFSRGMRLKLGLLLGLIRPSSVLMPNAPTSALYQQGTLLIGVDIFNLVLGMLTTLLLTIISWRGFQRQVERFSAESKESLLRV